MVSWPSFAYLDRLPDGRWSAQRRVDQHVSDQCDELGLAAVDLASEGFPLVGGRVTIVDRVPTPTLVYRHNEHFVAVTELPVDAKPARETGGIETIDGYHVARWADANLTYVAVSDMDERALGEFVEAFRRGGGPAIDQTRP